jgi:ribosomal protein S18 acetylase RimI-like enzyme
MTMAKRLCSLTMFARSAAPADYEAYVRLFAELGVPDPVPERARWETEMLPHTLVIEQDGALIAYVYGRSLGDVGYVFNVVVDPACRGRGVGRALMHAVGERLRALGCARWCLNVKVDNEPAIHLYERCGLRRAYRSWALRLAWDRVGALPREEGSILARPFDPAEDAALEAAFEQVPGRLADRRSRPTRVLLRLVDPARPDDAKVGLASFDPAHPGAFPFAVARPALAAVMLDALRPHARSSDDALMLLIERDDALAETLRAAGAETVFELFHMNGDIPLS